MQLIDLENDSEDIVFVLRMPNGERESITKDKLLRIVREVLMTDEGLPRQPPVMSDLEPDEQINLFKLGKRVAGLIATSGETKVLGFLNAMLLSEWLKKFDGVIPRRFSSKVGQRLREIQKWLGVDERLLGEIDEFLKRYYKLESRK